MYRFLHDGRLGPVDGSDQLHDPTRLDLGAWWWLLWCAAHELPGVVLHGVCLLSIVCPVPAFPYSQGSRAGADVQEVLLRSGYRAVRGRWADICAGLCGRWPEYEVTDAANVT